MNCDVASVAHSFRCMNKLNKYNSKSTVIVVYRVFFFLCVHLFVCVCSSFKGHTCRAVWRELTAAMYVFLL